MEAQEILDIKMSDNDAQAKTIRGYLIALLKAIWKEGESFSGKRPFGNSGWEYELYKAVAAAGFVDCVADEDGYIDEIDTEKADSLIVMAISGLDNPPH